MSKIYNNRLGTISFVEIHIKSFSKIHLNQHWVKDLSNLIYNYNIKYLMSEIKYLKKEYYSLFNLLIVLSRSRIYENSMSKLLHIKLLKEIHKVVWELISLIKLKYYTKKNLNIVRLPIKAPKINILKSPHVFKKAQDHYEIRSHKMIIQIPLLVLRQSFITDIITQTTKLSSLYRVNIKRKNVFIIKKNNFKK